MKKESPLALGCLPDLLFGCDGMGDKGEMQLQNITHMGL